jgi:hypothetical protein
MSINTKKAQKRVKRECKVIDQLLFDKGIQMQVKSKRKWNVLSMAPLC